MPLSVKYLQAFTPALIIGNLTTICGFKADKISPSLIIPSKSVEMTSAETSPSTIEHIAL